MDDEEEMEVEAVLDKDEFPWAQDDDERRRCFVFVQMTNCPSANLGTHEIPSTILIETFEAINNWIKDGTVPAAATKKSPLRTV